MIQRLQKLSQKHSFFLFGARGTGKTTLLKQLFPQKNSLWIDLLSFEEEDRFNRNPDLLSQLLSESHYKRVIVDEVQKVPKLLDIVHLEIEKNKKTQFILTGSSSRKLKKGKANLLAGRLWTFALHPLTHLEGKNFSLPGRLRWGAMPALGLYKRDQDRRRYLESYVQTYLKEEILAEQLVKNIRPFRGFLELSAQCSGQIVNYSKIARNVGVDWTTVKKYFDILTDTYLGFYLKSFNRSFRKQLNQAPKFYLFDLGVQRVLSQETHVNLPKSGYEYGRIFEHFILLELFRLNSCLEAGFRFSYLRDKDGNEVDLIIQKPGGSEILVEIKSGTRALQEHSKTLHKFMKTWDRPCAGQLWSNDPKNRRVKGISFLHWKTALKRLFH